MIGNHLTQHADLSLLAIGLACHIQSLPPGARVDIKTLAARFPEGATRIAAALRELETHGYLRRERARVPGGRIVTRTISCNQPGRRREASGPTPAPRRKQTRRTALPAVPKPVYPSPLSSRRPPRSSPACAAGTPAYSSPPRTPNTSHPASRPGWNGTFRPRPYARP